MTTIQFLPIAFVEIIIIFVIFMTLGKKFARPRLFFVVLLFIIILLDMVIGFVFK